LLDIKFVFVYDYLQSPALSFLISFSPLVIGFKTTMTLSRSLLNGALAIAGITAAFSFATEAQAANFTGTVGQVKGSGFSIQVGDKLFSDFVVPTGSGQFQADDFVSITNNEPGFEVLFSAGPTAPANLSVAGTLSYKVAIVSPFINIFNAARTSTAITGGTRSVNRETTITGVSPNPLVSLNGSSPSGTFASSLQTINVSDSWFFGTTGSQRNISSITTSFDQFPEFATTPEPSAVLGLLALGLCGTLVGRKKG
jgi:hypothetical protein